MVEQCSSPPCLPSTANSNDSIGSLQHLKVLGAKNTIQRCIRFPAFHLSVFHPPGLRVCIDPGKWFQRHQAPFLETFAQLKTATVTNTLLLLHSCGLGAENRPAKPFDRPSTATSPGHPIATMNQPLHLIRPGLDA
ncbi:hypothetical protein HYQ46_010824 [Verticillium longisporum]|nr:hypothetical protein HYQ46_010824 [Verticillium longisporum]